MLAAGRAGQGQPVGQRRRLDDDAAELVPPVLALADDVRGGEEEGRRQVVALEHRSGAVQIVGIAVVEGDRRGMPGQASGAQPLDQLGERQHDLVPAEHIELLLEVPRCHAERPRIEGDAGDTVVQQDQRATERAQRRRPQGPQPGQLHASARRTARTPIMKGKAGSSTRSAGAPTSEAGSRWACASAIRTLPRVESVTASSPNTSANRRRAE
jgi:hypothetical protein